MSELKFPTEVIELPSKGLLYPADHPLANGTVEMKYMTAREEDILTNPNYIEKGIVVEKLLQSLLITKVDLNEFFTGDKNAIMLAARILGYGKDYTITHNGKEVNVDLTQLTEKAIDESILNVPNGLDVDVTSIGPNSSKAVGSSSISP